MNQTKICNQVRCCIGQCKIEGIYQEMEKIEYLNLKPDNIMVKKELIKLVDYGIKFLNYEKINNYMSPELFKN